MKFSKNLKRFRKNAGYTAKELAQKLELPYTTYAAYENQDREPKFDTLMKIAAALHVSIDELIGYTLNTPDDLKNAIDTFRQYGFTVQEGGKDYNGAAREDIFQVTDSKYNLSIPVSNSSDLIGILDKAAENKYYRQRKADLFHDAIVDELIRCVRQKEWAKANSIAENKQDSTETEMT